MPERPQPVPSRTVPAGENVAPTNTPSTSTSPNGAGIPAGEAHPFHTQLNQEAVSRWISQGIDQGVKPDQALAFIGLGLMRRMLGAGVDPAWVWSEAAESSSTQGSADLSQLRQRLELTRLAIDTGAPLNTAEVTQLMGARPGGSVVERGGLRARRLSRNVWQLSRCGDDGQRTSGGGSGGYQESFRRRL